MRTEVTFRHPAPFVPVSPADDGILATSGAEWFASLLRRVPGLEVEREFCQEDWGVVLWAQRGGRSYWIGLSAGPDEGVWHARVHHRSFAWLRRLSASSRADLERVVTDIDVALAGDSAVSDITWHEEGQAW